MPIPYPNIPTGSTDYVNKINANFTDISESKDVNDAHITDPTIHVTQSDKDDWDGKAPQATTYTKTETDNLLDDKADAIHTHDDRYYTESEVDALIAAVGGGSGGTSNIEELNVSIKAGESIAKYDVVNVVNGEVLKVLSTEHAEIDSGFDNEGRVDDASIVLLSDNNFLMCYIEQTTLDVKAVIGTLYFGDDRKSQLVFGAPVTVESNPSAYVKVKKISNDKYVVAYQDTSDTYGYVRVLSPHAEADSIYVGGRERTNATGDTKNHLELLRESDTGVIILESNETDNEGLVSYCDVDADYTLDNRTYKSFGVGKFDTASICRLSESYAVVAFSDEGDLGKGKALLVRLDAPFMYLQTIYTFADYDTSATDGADMTVLPLSESKIIIFYVNATGQLVGIVGDIAGTVITFGTEQVLNTNVCKFVRGTELRDGNVVVSYFDDTPNDIFGSVCSVLGTTITIENTFTLYNLASGTSVVQDIIEMSEDGRLMAAVQFGDSIKLVVQDNFLNNSYEAIVKSTDGSTCDLIYSGTLSDAEIAKNTTVESGNPKSIIGHAPVDGKLAVKGYWERT